jgi:hypothetical protein
LPFGENLGIASRTITVKKENGFKFQLCSEKLSSALNVTFPMSGSSWWG